MDPNSNPNQTSETETAQAISTSSSLTRRRVKGLFAMGTIAGTLLLGLATYAFVTNAKSPSAQATPTPLAPVTATERAALKDQAAPSAVTILQVTNILAESGEFGNLIAKALQVTGEVNFGTNLRVSGNGFFGGQISAANFDGSGANLTGVDAALFNGRSSDYYTNVGNLQGELSDGQLSANVALRNSPNTFSANNTFTGGITVSGPTSLNGTTTISSLVLSAPLSVPNGGTGLSTIPVSGVLYGQGTAGVGVAVPGSAGQCLVSTATDVQFGSCVGGAAVSSLNGLTGALSLANATGAGSTVTINDATTAAKGIASFNATNFSVTAGAVNTVQNIAVTSAPTFAGLTLSSALTVANGGTGASSLTSNGVIVGQGTGALIAVTSGAAGQCLVSTAGAPSFQACPTGAGGVTTLNGLNGAITVANASAAAGTITINDATTAAKGIASFNSTNFSVSSGAVNTIQNISVGSTPLFAGLNLTAALTVGNGGTGATTAGGARTNLGAAASGANSDITSLSGLSTALSVAQGGTGVVTTPTNGQILIGNGTNYSLNTLSAGSGVTITNGAGTIQISAAGAGTCAACANQSLSNLSGVAINTSLLPGAAGTVNLGAAALPFGQLRLAGTSATPATNSFLITGASTGGVRTIVLPDASGTVAVSASGPLGLDAAGNLTCATCLTSGGGGGSAGVSSVNGQTGALTIANASATSGTITIDDATYTTKGIASFNTQNFTISGGAVNTVQDIDTAAAPHFNALELAGDSITFTTPLGTSLASSLAIMHRDYGDFVQAIAVGLEAASGQNARGIVVYDARAAGSHQPSIGVASPDETALIGLSWDGVNTEGAVETTNSASANTKNLRASSGAVTGGTGLNSGNVNVSSGTNAGSGGSTGNINIASGAGLGTNNSTGSISIDAGAKTGSGTNGSITIGATNAAALIMGRSGAPTTIQGNASSVWNVTGGGFTTSLGFSGTPTGAVNYQLDRAVAAGTYTICTTIGNCSGGGGTITGSGTTNKLAKFTGSGAIGDSSITDTGTSVTLASNVDLILAGATAYISNPQMQTRSEAFGLNASVDAPDSTAVGYNAIASTESVTIGANAGTANIGTVAIGYSASANTAGTSIGHAASVTGNNGVAIGSGTSAAGESIALGTLSSASYNQSIAIGYQATTSATNQLVVGGSTASTAYISNVYFGSGVADVTPKNVVIHATGGSGANVGGASLSLAGGIGTGTGNGGDINFQTAKPGTTGSGANTLSTVASLSGANGAALFKNAVDSATAFRIQNAAGTATYLNVDTTATNTVTFGTDTDLIMQGATAYISNTQGENNSEAFGQGATVVDADSVAFGKDASGGFGSVAIGTGAENQSSYGVAIGNNSISHLGSTAVGRLSYAWDASVAVGANADSHGNYSVVVGASAVNNFDSAIVLGNEATSTAAHQLIVGSASEYVDNGYFGGGVSSATPQSFTLHVTGGSGANVAGGSLSLAGGIGTGTGNGGDINLQTAKPGLTGSGANSLSTVASLSGANGAALFKNSVDSATGFRIQNAAGNTTYLNVDTTSTNAITFGTNTDLIMQGSTAYISNPQGQSNSEVFGQGATATSGNSAVFGAGASGAFSSVAVGDVASADSGGTAVGAQAVSGFDGSSFGFQANAPGNYAVALGAFTTADARAIAIGTSAAAHFQSIVVGYSAASTGSQQLVVGGSTAANGYVNDGYFGSGVVDATPQSFTLHVTGGSGANVAGGSLSLAGGQGTGTGNGGNINFQVAKPGSTGSGANSLSTVASLSGVNGAALFKNSANSTSAFQIQNAAGANIFSADTSGGVVTFGNAATNVGQIAFANGSNTNLVNLQSGVTSTTYTTTLPTAIGGAGQCLAVASIAGSNQSLGYASCAGSTGVTLQGTTPGTPDTGNFNVSGTGIAAAIKTDNIDSRTSTALSIGGTNATSVGIGSTTSNIPTTISGTTVIKPSAGNDSATALQVQNAAGTSLLTADTLTGRLVVGASTGLDLDGGYLSSPYGGFGAGENDLSYSEAFDQAVWTKSNITVTANDGASNPAPSGQTTADKLVSTAINGTVTQAYTTTTNGTYTFSVWLKSNSGTPAVGLRINSTGATPTTGTTTSVNLSNEWKRYVVSQTFTGTPSNIKPEIQINVNATTIVAWGAQLAIGPQAGSYVASYQTPPASLEGAQVNGRVTVTGPNGELSLHAQDGVGNNFGLYSATGELTFYGGLNIRAVMAATGQLGIGDNMITPTARLQVASATAENLLQVTDTTAAGTAQVLTVADEGAVTLQNRTDSAAALSVKTSGGTSLLTADTTASQILLGQVSTLAGKLVFANASNANLVGLTTASGSAGYSLTLPSVAPALGECLKAGAGTATLLTFGTCATGSTGVTLQGTTPGTPDTGNFNVSGVGIAGTGLLSPSLDNATATSMNIGTSNATTINLGRSGQNLNVNSAGSTFAGYLSVNGTTTAAPYKLFTSGTVNSSVITSQYGIENGVDFNPSGASLANIFAFSNIANISGSSINVSNLIGTSTAVSTGAGYTGTVADARGFNIGSPVILGSQLFTKYTGLNIAANSVNGGNTSGTKDNYQIALSGITAGAGSGGTVNNYGVSITQPAGTGTGTTNNYGLYLSGAGAGSANWSIYNASSADSYYAGNILVGTTSNANGYNLNLNGTIGASTSIRTAAVDSQSGALALGTAAATTITLGRTGQTVDVNSAINLNQSGVVAAGKSLTITGGNTASRPGSPTEGMMYFDTTTKQLLTYSNGKWQGDRAGATKIVAASDSSQAAKDSADYVGDGETASGSGFGTIDGDQIEINSALTALATSGGTVYLMEGTYTVDASISIPNNVTLAGSGGGTLVRLGNFGSGSNNIHAITNTTTSSGTSVGIRDLRIDGRRTLNTGGTQRGIYMNGMGSGTGTTATVGAIIKNVWVQNFLNDGVYFTGSMNSSITDSHLVNNFVSAGVFMTGGHSNKIEGNLSQGNSYGIRVQSSTNNSIVDNVLQDNVSHGIMLVTTTNSVVSSNVSTGNGGDGIMAVTTSTGNTVSGNTVQASGSIGIEIQSSSSYNNVTGNTISGSGDKGIGLDTLTNSNTITANHIHDSSGATANNGIYLGTTADSNSITANEITDTSCSTTCYAINIFNSNSDNNILSSNHFTSTSGTPTINDAGTGTIYSGQINSTGQIVTSSAGTIEKSTANIATAFQIQKANGDALFTADTSGNSLTIGKASTFAATLQFANAGNANLVGLTAASGTAAYALTLPSVAPALGECLKAGAVTATLLTFGSCAAGSTGVTLQGTTPGTPDTGNFNISGTGIAANLKAATLDSASGTLAIGTTTATTITLGRTGQTLDVNSSINLNQSGVVAAGKSLTVTGGITSSRPGSPTEGMVYFDTTTKQLLTYSNGKWQGDRSAASKIVAASDSSQAAKDAADYVANGEDSAGSGIGTLDGDQTEINLALTALGSAGGTVYLMEGTYTLDAAISMPDNTTLAGSGASTVVQLGNFGGSALTINAISNTATARVTVRDIRMDGRKTLNTGGTYRGIYMNAIGSSSNGTAIAGANIKNVGVYNFLSDGVNFTASRNSSVTDSHLVNNSGSGIYVSTGSSDKIANNTTQGNGYGIQLNFGANDTVSNNIAQRNTTAGVYLNGATTNAITGNILEFNGYGILLSGSSTNNTISSNNIPSSTTSGIRLQSLSHYNSVTGNTVSTSTAAGISLDTVTSNTITANHVYDSSGATDNNGISLATSDTNLITANEITDISCSTTCYAINISNSASDNNLLSANHYTSGGSTPTINDAGTGTIFSGQINSTGQIVTSSAGTIEKSTANIATAFQIQKANGDALFTADTSGNSLTIGKASTFAATLQFANAGNANLVGLTAASGTAAYTLTLPSVAPAVGECLKAGAGTATLLAFGSCAGGGVSLQGSTPGTPDTGNFNISGTGIAANLKTATLDSASGTLAVGATTATTITLGRTGQTLDVNSSINLNQSAVLAAGKSLAITGGNTASRPGSPTEGMVYFDTTTKQLLTYSNGKWQGDRAGATKIVAASNSTQAAKDAADYVANGEDSVGAGIGTLDGDQIEINSAMAAVGSLGGTVYLMEGTYTLDASISIPQNVTLAGSGTGTIVQLGNFGSTSTSVDAITNTQTTAGTGVTVRNLLLDGRRTTNLVGTQVGVYMNGMGSGSGTTAITGAKIVDVTVKNFLTKGVYFNGSVNSELTQSHIVRSGYGIHENGGSSNRISNNTVQGSSQSGILVQSSSKDTVTENILQNNDNANISLNSSNNNTITANVAELSSGGSGIALSASSNNIITGNMVKGNSVSGIDVSSSSQYNNVSGNTSDGNAGTGIIVTGSNYNSISSNNIYDTGGSTANNGIYLTTADYTIVTGNKITDTACSTTCYAINISTAGSDNTYLSANIFSTTSGTASINDSGTGTIYANQSLASDGGQALFKNANNATAFQIQNATGGDLFTVDTLGSSLTIGKANSINATLKFANTSNTNIVGIRVANATAAYTLTLPSVAPNVGECLKAGAVTATSLAFGSCAGGGVSLQGSTPGTPDTGNFNISGTGIAATLQSTLNILAETTAPSGTSGYGKLYVSSTDHALHFVNASGTDTAVAPSTHVKTTTFAPEYAGAVFNPDGSNNTGFMSTGYASGLASGQGYKHNYYSWTSDQATAQDYDIVMQYQLPSDFSSFVSSSWKIWTYVDSTTSTAISWSISSSTGASCYAATQSAKPSSATTWEQITLTNPGNGCTFAAGDVLTIAVKPAALTPATNQVRVGEFQYQYNTAY